MVKLNTFSGQLQYSITRHKRTSTDTELLTKDAFTYSPQDRLLTQTHQINAGTIEVIANNTYDELGQLISKKVGNTIAAPTQKVDYTYNIRGWMTGINNTAALQQGSDPKDLFAFKINYNNTPGITGGKALYNGNIAETFWISTSETTPVIRGYAYLYDNLNRLKTSIYKRDAVISNAYSENLTYDKNGNIGSINRNGNSETATQIDALVYTYTNSNTTNQLLKVVDSAPATTKIYGFTDSAANTDDYSYDANGNMTKDNNKNMTAITYNHLNLPTKITFATTGNIGYIYNAAGQKVQKIVKEGVNETITDYLGGYQYVKTPATSTMLKFFPTAEGYVEVSGSSYKYVYQYKDHLGNIRLSYDKNLAIQDENQYYPFGLLQKRPTDAIVASNYKYKFNGKELQDELGLNFYDYGARNYDPSLGRWMNIDPLAEKVFSFSPYTYAVNNPIYFVDPDGKQIDISLTYKKDKERNEVRDKDGNRTLTNVNITITGKVINFSDNNVDMNQAVSDITSSLEKSFSGDMDGVKVKTTANFSVAKSMNDVKDSDHLLVLADKMKPQTDENGRIGFPYGASNFLGGRVAFVDADYFSGMYDKYIGNQGERTSTHEFGHLFGLEHVMGGLMQGGGDGTNLSPTQFGTIIKNYKEGKLNYGTNSTIFGLPNTGIIGSDNVILTNTNGRAKKKG